MTATAGKTYYHPGLVFKAHEKAQGHQEVCFAGAPEVRNADGSLQREAIRPLVAEFGVYGGEYTYSDPLTGTTEIGSDFRGGYFNLDQQAEEKQWDDREKEIVARHMLTLPHGRAQFTLYSQPKVGPPWPTYDATHHSKVVEFAQLAGLVSEALLYERQEKNRPSVVEGLEKALDVAPVEVDELVAG